MVSCQCGENIMPEKIKQKTIAKVVECSGIGIHSGKNVYMKIKPAPVNHGIKFVRKDILDKPKIPAHFNMIVDTNLATVLGSNGVIISTIEHLMASFLGMGIDNVLVELDTYEIPIMDGSAAPFTKLIRSAGIYEQKSPRFFFVVRKPIELKKDEKSVGIYPSSSFKITYMLDYNHPLLKEQSYSIEVTDKTFEEEISKARTFGFLHEIKYLERYGFAKGGSLDNAIIVDEKNVVNKDGLRFKDEFVRHKILDCIGDFSLIGMPIIGHIKAYKSGHAFNHALLNKIFEQKECWKISTLTLY